MTLTTLHVRGKKKTPRTNVPLALHHLQHIKRQRRSMAAVLNSRSSHPRATLGNLPPEVLETILLYTCNVALPLASNLIGAKLSDRATLVRVVIRAFDDTWDQWFGVPTSKSVFFGPQIPDAKMVPCEGDFHLQVVSPSPDSEQQTIPLTRCVSQTAVLALPWAKVDILLQAQQTWADRYSRERWYQHSIPWEDSPEVLCHSRTGGYRHFNARECFEVDYQQALKWRPFKTESVPWCAQDVHPLTRVPSNLLAGPWDDEMQRRLFWLSRGGIAIDSDFHSSQPWETKWDCLRNAVLDVQQPNTLVVNCIMRSWLFTDLPRDLVKAGSAKLSKRLLKKEDTPAGMEIVRRTRNAMDMFLHLPDYIKPQ